MAEYHALGRPALVDRIRRIIVEDGPIAFDRFMDLALYDPDDGYYRWRGDQAEQGAGPTADFQTSPQVHPSFGHLVAAELIRVWEALERPLPFVVVEPGAGDGTLARQILAGLRDRETGLDVAYHAADARLAGVPSDYSNHNLIAWPNLAALNEVGVVAHCVVSNEFFDALPVHRIAVVNGRLREIYVDWTERGFVERVGGLSDEALEARVLRNGRLPTEGWRGEVCLSLDGILAMLAGRLGRGVMLTIDYGYDSRKSTDDVTPGETLASYHRHQWNDDVYARVGEQDLTSHVDFGALVQLGRRHGLEPAGELSQREFLFRRGIKSEAERWAARERTPGRQWQTRFALAELTRDDGLGRLVVLAQQKGVPTYSLA